MCALAAALSVVPAGAEGPGQAPAPTPVPTTHTGRILLPAVAPDMPRRAYLMFGEDSNGFIGAVFPLAPGADGKTYTLAKTTPLPGNPDVYFYDDDDGRPGQICSPVSSPDESGTYLDSQTETGVICPGAQVGRWAVVVLFSGAGVSFELSY